MAATNDPARGGGPPGSHGATPALDASRGVVHPSPRFDAPPPRPPRDSRVPRRLRGPPDVPTPVAADVAPSSDRPSFVAADAPPSRFVGETVTALAPMVAIYYQPRIADDWRGYLRAGGTARIVAGPVGHEGCPERADRQDTGWYQVERDRLVGRHRGIVAVADDEDRRAALREPQGEWERELALA